MPGLARGRAFTGLLQPRRSQRPGGPSCEVRRIRIASGRSRRPDSLGPDRVSSGATRTPHLGRHAVATSRAVCAATDGKAHRPGESVQSWVRAPRGRHTWGAARAPQAERSAQPPTEGLTSPGRAPRAGFGRHAGVTLGAPRGHRELSCVGGSPLRFERPEQGLGATRAPHSGRRTGSTSPLPDGRTLSP